MSTFLPVGYENLKTEKNYWRLSQMKDGENRLRIVAQPIAGWLDWIDKKPVRYQPDQKPARSYNPEEPMRPFWICHVWDYDRKDLYVLEITQSSIQKALTALGRDEDWGDFTKYDIKINKSGTGKDTRYTLMPVSHKPFNAEIEDALIAKPVRLEALYFGGDPWTDLDDSDAPQQAAVTQAVQAAAAPALIGTPLETLREHLEVDGVDTNQLVPYIEGLAHKKGQEASQVIQAALMPQLLAKFKASYLKHLSANPELQAQAV